jgi:hypothetical protein
MGGGSDAKRSPPHFVRNPDELEVDGTCQGNTRVCDLHTGIFLRLIRLARPSAFLIH